MRTALFALVLGVVVAGCNPEDASDLKRDAGQLQKTATRAASNATVAVKVNTAVSLRKGVDMSGLHIESKGGVVTVSGHVRNPEEKRVVIETVTNTRGVEQVVDQLNVEPPKK